jgi:hypothetical protein
VPAPGRWHQRKKQRTEEEAMASERVLDMSVQRHVFDRALESEWW